MNRVNRDVAISDAQERLIYAYVGQDHDEVAAAKSALVEAKEIK